MNISKRPIEKKRKLEIELINNSFVANGANGNASISYKQWNSIHSNTDFFFCALN